MLRAGQQWTQPFTLVDEPLPHADPAAHLSALADGHNGPSAHM